MLNIRFSWHCCQVHYLWKANQHTTLLYIKYIKYSGPVFMCTHSSKKQWLDFDSVHIMLRLERYWHEVGGIILSTGSSCPRAHTWPGYSWVGSPLCPGYYHHPNELTAHPYPGVFTHNPDPFLDTIIHLQYRLHYTVFNSHCWNLQLSVHKLHTANALPHHCKPHHLAHGH